MFKVFADCIKNKYATFQGRARRREYWLFYLCNMLVAFVLTAIQTVIIIVNANKTMDESMLGILMIVPIIVLLYSLFVLIPGLSVTVRRLHDTDHSGAYILMNLIPLAGPIILLVALCSDGTLGQNQYGRNPKEVAASIDDPVNPFPGTSTVNVQSSLGETAPIQAGGIIETTINVRKLRVICTNGPDARKSAEGEVVYIGRNPSLCQLILPNSATVGVSSVHCMLHASNKGIEVRDLGSRNGTFLTNGKKLEPNVPIFLPSGSTLYLGSPRVSVVVEMI